MKFIPDIPLYLSAGKDVSRSLVRNRRILATLTKKDISDPYPGQMLGKFWAIGHPLFLVALYATVFTFVFQARIGGTFELPLDYTVYILSGLVPWLTFQQAMLRGCAAITSHASIVKQVVFPVEVLPAKVVASSVVTLIVGIVFIVVYSLFKSSTLYLTYLLFPLLVIFHLLAMLGVAYCLAGVSVFVRDVKDVVQLFSIANIFLIPAIYLPSAVPSVFQPILKLNPFSYLVWAYQDVFYYGRIEHPAAWVVLGVGGPIMFCIGYRVFRSLRPYFGSVL